MLSNSQHYYHPFKEPYFGFLLKDHTSPENTTGFIVDNIDLYYQPVQEPVIAIIFFFLRMILVIIGEFIHIKVFIILKKENGLVKDVAKLFTATQMIFWPFWLLLTTSTDFVHPLNIVIGQWFCTFSWFFFFLCWTIIAFHSFIVALMRYFFIVHDKKVAAYGKEKAKKVFLLLSFLIPLLVVIWGAIEDPELNAMSFINKCYGNHHKVFLIETSTLNVVKRNFCEFENFDESGSFGKILAIVKRVSCIAKTTVMLIMGFNFTEAIIYYKIVSHIHRYHNI